MQQLIKWCFNFIVWNSFLNVTILGSYQQEFTSKVLYGACTAFVVTGNPLVPLSVAWLVVPVTKGSRKSVCWDQLDVQIIEKLKYFFLVILEMLQGLVKSLPALVFDSIAT